jgi:cell filamentation protein, protein adenylyltransferase
MSELVQAKAAVLALTQTPYQRNWVEELQKIQLKREVAGTSKIEGADFTDSELETAIKPGVSPDELLTRSQKQAHSAVETYRWIAQLPNDLPITTDLVREVHRRIVQGCDDDHCAPGELRGPDCNVIFGAPAHRGCEGGLECQAAFERLVQAVQHEFRDHDLLVQALALHYHFAAMHPFLDGNGRTARALEALVLQGAGLTDRAFIAMSNYYYDEKNSYLAALAAVRANNHDLTQFLIFGLRGVRLQSQRLFAEIRKNMQRALFRNMMFDLFNRLENTRKRVIKNRQIEILKVLLGVDEIDFHELAQKVQVHYGGKSHFGKAFIRDMSGLIELRAIKIDKVADHKWNIAIRLEWPSEITDSDFFEKIRNMPKGKMYKFL